MVELHAHVVLVALQDGLGKHRLVGRSRVGVIVEAMALLIGLGKDIQTVLVTQVIPLRVVRIVAGAHSVDVHALHLLDVGNHALTRHDIATIGIHLVAVGTLDVDGLAVDEQLTVLDVHTAETHFYCGRLAFRFFVCWGKRGNKAVEVGRLGCPAMGGRYGPAVFASRRHGYFVTLGIKEMVTHRALA